MSDATLIDISGAEQRAGDSVLAEVEAACCNIGFMYVVGHGITPQTIAKIRSAAIAYFAWPLEQKLFHSSAYFRNSSGQTNQNALRGNPGATVSEGRRTSDKVASVKPYQCQVTRCQ